MVGVSAVEENLAYAICEGLNKEIFMVSEYKCTRCFISKNIMGARESFSLSENIFVYCPH